MAVTGVQEERKLRASYDGMVFERLVGGNRSWLVYIKWPRGRKRGPRVTPENLRLIADRLEAADVEAGD